MFQEWVYRLQKNNTYFLLPTFVADPVSGESMSSDTSL